MEKTYIEIMNEFTKEELYERLVKYGLFSDKLPKVFNGESFFEYCKEATQNFDKGPYDSMRFESVRNNFGNRTLGIPTPFAHQLLCRCICDNWDKIKEKYRENTKNNTYKVSRIHIRKLKDKKEVFEMNYSNYRVDGTPEMDLLIGKRFLVKTDISTCFPSMYSHALSWAIVGKEEAKKTKRDDTKWYNQLDLVTRNEKAGETHGFIIGPHTSNILSEIILTEVDKNITEKGYKYIRNIDDYSCYVKDEKEAREFIQVLESELSKYDLLLNYKKTKIISLPVSNNSEWVRKLNSFSFNEIPLKFPSVRSYLDFAIELVNKYEDIAILKYAIKVLCKKKLTKNAERYFIKTVFHYSLIYQYLIPILGETIFDIYDIEKDDKSNIINQIYDCGIKLRNYEAVVFALYYAKKYDVELKDLDIEDVKTDKNSLVPLFAYKYFEKDKKMCREIKNYAKELMEREEIDRHWLFIYEVLPKTELKGVWKNMKDKKVTFINF